MTNYRKSLPQLGQQLFLTDGGMETTMIFHKHIDLPGFASFPLLDTEDGLAALNDYFRTYLDIAAENKTGFVLEATKPRTARSWLMPSRPSTRLGSTWTSPAIWTSWLGTWSG